MAQTTGESDALLLERDRELHRIAGFLQRGQQGHGGALVVEGPAGIGKTVLLAASRDVAEGEGFRVLRARGAELEREFAFGVVRAGTDAPDFSAYGYIVNADCGCPTLRAVVVEASTSTSNFRRDPPP